MCSSPNSTNSVHTGKPLNKYNMTRMSSCVKTQRHTAYAVPCPLHVLPGREGGTPVLVLTGGGRTFVLGPDWGTPLPPKRTYDQRPGVPIPGKGPGTRNQGYPFRLR